MAGGKTGFRVLALARGGAAVLVLGLGVFAWLSPALESNALLEPVIKVQFSAALYGFGLAGITVLCFTALALVTGRVFCSVFCPLGTLQELAWRTGKLFARRRGIFRSGYTPPPAPRYVIPLLTGLGLVLAFVPLMIIFDPLSNFGRGMGLLRSIRNGNAGVFGLVIALPLLLILAVAFFRGRAFCGWCPVGLSLGLFSSFAPLRMKIAPEKCVSCGICEKKCPAACIDSKEKRLDAGRCVLCFSCAAACPGGGVGYGFCGGSSGGGSSGGGSPGRSSPGGAASGTASAVSGESRRNFLKTAAPLACGALYLFSPGLRSLIGPASGPAASGANPPILPPGAKNLRHYQSRCTGCQACVAACPAGIIRIGRIPNPVLDYRSASCQYNCNECGRVCPTQAIAPLGLETKQRTRIALSTLLFENCVVKTRGEACGACAEVCPTRAVRMTAYPESNSTSLTRPVFDEPYCIGCGACLAACPAEPRAFTLAALAEQSLGPGIRPAEEEAGGLYNPENEFPF